MKKAEVTLVATLKNISSKLRSLEERINNLDIVYAASRVVDSHSDELSERIIILGNALDISDILRREWVLQEFNDESVEGNLFLLLETDLIQAPQLLIHSRNIINGIPVRFVGWKLLSPQRIHLKFKILLEK